MRKYCSWLMFPTQRTFLAVSMAAALLLACSTSSNRVSKNQLGSGMGGAEGVESGTASSTASPTTTSTNDAAIQPPEDPREIAARRPFVRLQTNSAGELLLDYRFNETNNAAPPPQPVIEITPTGAVARNGRHTVEFDGNLNNLDAVVIRLPSGAVLQGGPVALSVIDADGTQVWLGEIQDCAGEIHPEFPDQVIYRNAFSGILADVRFTYTLNSIEQDIIFRERTHAVSATTEKFIAANYGSHTIQYEIPQSVFGKLPTGDPTLGEVVFKNNIPDRYRVGTYKHR